MTSHSPCYQTGPQRLTTTSRSGSERTDVPGAAAAVGGSGREAGGAAAAAGGEVEADAV